MAEFKQSRGRDATPTERAVLWNQATLSSRPSKSRDLINAEDLHDHWRAEAAGLGFNPTRIVTGLGCAVREKADRYARPEIMVDTTTQIPESVVDHVLAVAEQARNGLSDAELDWCVHSVINAHPNTFHLTCDGIKAVDRVASAIRQLVQGRLVAHDHRWWSPGTAAAELATMAWLSSPAHPPNNRMSTNVEGLGTDQAEAATVLLNGETVGAVVVGPAGSGKTTMLRRVADALRTGNTPVRAVAPTAVAAATLGKSIGVTAETIAKTITDPQPLPAGGWVIVDEAAMVSTRDLAALCGKTAAAGGRMILVGDPAQQKSIAVGGMFPALIASRKITTVALSKLWRFTNHQEAAATARIRTGDITGLSYHLSHHRVRQGTHSQTSDLVAKWWEQHKQLDTVISAPTTVLMGDINRQIAERRHQLGETGPTITTTSTQQNIREGDLVTTRRNDRRLKDTNGEHVRNGDRWTVTGTGGNGGIRLCRHQETAQIVLDKEYVKKHLQLGHAITQTRAQSLTVQSSLTVVNARSKLDQLYVGLTRGRTENHLLVLTDPPTHNEDTPPPHTPPLQVLKEVFTRKTEWETITGPATEHLPRRSTAKQHLTRISSTPHNQPLPHLPNLPIKQILTRHQPVRNARPELPTANSGSRDEQTQQHPAIGAENPVYYQTRRKAWEIVDQHVPSRPRMPQDTVAETQQQLLADLQITARTYDFPAYHNLLRKLVAVSDPATRTDLTKQITKTGTTKQIVEKGATPQTVTTWAQQLRVQAIRQRSQKWAPLLDQLDTLADNTPTPSPTTSPSPKKPPSPTNKHGGSTATNGSKTANTPTNSSKDGNKQTTPSKTPSPDNRPPSPSPPNQPHHGNNPPPKRSPPRNHQTPKNLPAYKDFSTTTNTTECEKPPKPKPARGNLPTPTK